VSKQIFLTGYAKLPQGITATELYSVICIGMLVDLQSGTIIDAECSLITNLAKKVFHDLVIGKDLKDIEAIEAEFVQFYYGSAKKALISAMRTCSEKYLQILNQ